MDVTFSEAYRTKLRNRLKTAKLRVTEKFTAKEALETQDNQLKKDIELRASSRDNWKQCIFDEFNTQLSETVVSRDESFEFFFGNDNLVKSKNNETIIDSNKTIESPKRDAEQVIQIEDNPDNRDSRLLITDVLNSTNNWNFVEKCKTEVKSRKERIRDENQYLFIPSDKCLEISDESSVNQELKSLNKINSNLTAKNVNKLKNRLISEELCDKFLDTNNCFIDNNDRIDIKNYVYYSPQSDADLKLVSSAKPTEMSFKDILKNLFKGDNTNELINDSTNATKNKNERKLLTNLQSLNVTELNRLIQQLRINETENQHLISVIENYRQTIDGSNKSLNKELAKELVFASDEDIDNDTRLKLLTMRWQGVPQFKNYRFVPLNAKEIPKELFEENTTITPLSTSKHFEDRRKNAIELLTKVSQQLVKQSSGTIDRPRTLEDMVIEEDMPGISAIGFKIIPAAHQRRPLNPQRKERKKLAFNVIESSDIKIVITIMHGLNVPVRKKESNNSEFITPDIDFSYESKVCPFVEAVFQRESARTNTADGTKPTWNETLCLKFKAPEDECLPSNLAKINDCIYFNLFDEVLLDSDESITSDGQQVIHKRKERRWLGSLKIPFSTLYLNSKIEGTFSLSTPLLLLGYEYDAKGWLLGSDTINKDSSKQTYLTLFLTIDPSLQLPEPMIIKCDTLESESLNIYAKKYKSRLNLEFPNRNIKTLAVNMNAQTVLVTRYLRPLKPPEEFLTNFNVTNDIMQRLARYVSLIPKVPDSIAMPGVCDIWCTCDQFLDMLIGDEEEHAILLCNYFLYLEKRAAILLGNGIPEGLTAYVIVFEYGRDPYVFNASTGEQFSVRDSYIPLNSVGCIITPENIYANISKSDHPNRLNYDINKSSDWRPFFGKQYVSPPIVSIQPEVLNYTASDFDSALQLQEKLEKHLREWFMKWRKRKTTFFNRHIIQSIKKMLPRLESVGKVNINHLIQQLHDVFVLHEMTGFPLNMPFTDFNSITEAVFATGVHLAEDKSVEFALTVYVHPYPSNVFSVWVYVAALTRHSEP